MSIAVICRAVVALIFILAALTKMRNIYEFRLVLVSHGLIDGQLADAVAVAVVVSEIMVGCGLVLDRLLPWSVVSAVAMIGAFSGWVSLAMLIGKRSIKCGCIRIGMSNHVGLYFWLRNAGLVCLLLPSVVDTLDIAMASIGTVLLVLGISAVGRYQA